METTGIIKKRWWQDVERVDVILAYVTNSFVLRATFSFLVKKDHDLFYLFIYL